MKLIFCTKCQDVVRLLKEERSCKCGNCTGKYLDDINAVYSGETAIPLGISGRMLFRAIRNQPKEGLGKNFEAFVIPKHCETFEKYD